MKELYFGSWYCFFSDEPEKHDREKSGKWMHFFNDQEFAIDICRKAIEEGACSSCKCSDLEKQGISGVICFYLNGDDIESHKKVIDFMLKYNLIRKTQSGRYFNESFKFDNQTRAKEYGANFEGKLKLADFIDLYTGEWIHE